MGYKIILHCGYPCKLCGGVEGGYVNEPEWTTMTWEGQEPGIEYVRCSPFGSDPWAIGAFLARERR